MNLYKANLIHHTRAIQQCLPRFGVEAKADLATLAIEVRGRNRYYLLYPLYVARQGSRVMYTRHLVDQVRGFGGWLPYQGKRWPAGTGKFAFKDFCAKHGLRTPQMWRTPAPGMRDFLAKHELSSFSQALHGPFRSHDAGAAAQAIAADKGYYEAFVRGRILKAFYWEDRLAAVEMLDMPSVAGDGRSTLKELISRRVRAAMPPEEWKAFEEVAAYQDLSLDSILPKGRTVLADYRYGSPLHRMWFENENELSRLEGSPLLPQLAEIGRTLWQSIPEDIRPATLYTVDAAVDDKDQAWLLEMNSNPICHPDVYPMMFETLFGPARVLSDPNRPLTANAAISAAPALQEKSVAESSAARH